MKPTYYVTPENEDSFTIDDQFYVGDSGILVKPVTDEGATKTQIYVPEDEVYYDYRSSAHVYKGKGHHEVDVSLDFFPMLLRGGHIHARRDRERRSSTLMKYDPYTLVVSLTRRAMPRAKCISMTENPTDMKRVNTFDLSSHLTFRKRK